MGADGKQLRNQSLATSWRICGQWYINQPWPHKVLIGVISHECGQENCKRKEGDENEEKPKPVGAQWILAPELTE